MGAPYSLAGSAAATTEAKEARGEKTRAVMELREPAGAARPRVETKKIRPPCDRVLGYLGTCCLAAVVIALRPRTGERREIRVLLALAKGT